MDSIMIENFRCFGRKQTVRLAPLTLLVGENSTGKTSFMAMIRILWDAVYRARMPYFKEYPYDLGSFDEVAHNGGVRSGRAKMFKGEFSENKLEGEQAYILRYELVFEERNAAPFVKKLRYSSEFVNSQDIVWYEIGLTEDRKHLTKFGTANGEWELRTGIRQGQLFDEHPEDGMFSDFWFFTRGILLASEDLITLKSFRGQDRPSQSDINQYNHLANAVRSNFSDASTLTRSHAGAPVRSKPRRTYDPVRMVPDPEGDYVPMYLANTYLQNHAQWEELKKALEAFGREAGIFDELMVRPLGKRNTEPFQIQVRKYAARRKGPMRNMIDVGYGVSQVLPVITELLGKFETSLFLLQQPEVHLHPSAQAALGSLFCRLAGPERQLIVETHSDYLLDRVRMDVRDRKTELKPEDVSILFFERGDLDVRVREITLDKNGNLNTPTGYRKFFMEETRRSIGL